MIWALASMLLWGISAAYASVATKTGTALGAWAASTLVEALVVMPLLAQAKTSFTWSAVVVGICGGIGYGLFFLALASGAPAGSATAITALYPIVTALVAWIVFGQMLTPRQWVGVGLAVIAGVLIVTE